jgi:hypothetical protein
VFEGTLDSGEHPVRMFRAMGIKVNEPGHPRCGSQYGADGFRVELQGRQFQGKIGMGVQMSQ